MRIDVSYHDFRFNPSEDFTIYNCTKTKLEQLRSYEEDGLIKIFLINKHK